MKCSFSPLSAGRHTVLGVVITDDGVLYTVNGVAKANEHGPFLSTTKT